LTRQNAEQQFQGNTQPQNENEPQQELSTENVDEQSSESEMTNSTVRRSQRDRRAPRHLEDYVVVINKLSSSASEIPKNGKDIQGRPDEEHWLEAI